MKDKAAEAVRKLADMKAKELAENQRLQRVKAAADASAKAAADAAKAAATKAAQDKADTDAVHAAD